MSVTKVRSRDGGGWVVVVRGYGFVTRSALMSYAAACALVSHVVSHGYRRTS